MKRFTLTLCLFFVFVDYVSAELIVINPDSGLISLNGQPFANEIEFGGIRIEGGEVSSSIRNYRVHGDLNLNTGDVIRAEIGASLGARFLVGNDARIAVGAEIDFSGNGQLAGAGGGRGGSRGAAGIGFSGGRGGQGGAGGTARASTTPQGQSGDSGRNGAIGGSGSQGQNGGAGNSGYRPDSCKNAR